MAKSTLEMIQEIEDKAAKLDRGYQEQIAELEERQSERLENATALYKTECQASLAEYQNQLKEELKDAQDALKQMQDQYKQRTNDAMTKMRDELVYKIVTEVVNKYGN